MPQLNSNNELNKSQVHLIYLITSLPIIVLGVVSFMVAKRYRPELLSRKYKYIYVTIYSLLLMPSYIQVDIAFAVLPMYLCAVLNIDIGLEYFLYILSNSILFHIISFIIVAIPIYLVLFRLYPVSDMWTK